LITGAPSLILKRASASRPSGQWSENDYDVLADGAVVGRHADSRLRADARGRDGDRINARRCRLQLHPAPALA